MRNYQKHSHRFALAMPFLVLFGWTVLAAQDPLDPAWQDPAAHQRPPEIRFAQAPAPQPRQPLDTAPPPLDSTVAPRQPLDVTRLTSISAPPEFPGGSIADRLRNIADLPPQLAATPPPATEVVAGQSQLLGAPTTEMMIVKSNNNTTVSLQQRSAVSFDPRVRGYSYGQVYTQSDGQQWSPVRQDLDTMLSKIDPALIQNVVVIPGPYGLRYGPGFAFIDVQTSPTPRSQDGYQSHSRVGMNYRDNGEQIYGTASLYGGGIDWGYIVAYGNRTGNDYASGDQTKIPASYHNQNFLGQLGFDLAAHTRVEFRYQRLDQTDTEYAGQFFDVNFLKTDAFSLSLIDEDPCAWYTRFRVDAWYNQTDFAGDTRNQSKIEFNVINRVERALELALNSNNVSFVGDTMGTVVASGARAVTTVGQDDWTQLNLGVDLHYRKQRINEEFVINDVDNEQVDTFSTNLPRADVVDPGLFTELTLPMTSYWTATLGGRVDFVNTDASQLELSDRTNLNPHQLSQNDVLYGFYLLNDIELTRHWTTRFGFGHAQRPPTLTERYADGVFLGIIQSSFNRFIGTPNLDKERAWQIDLGLEAEYEWWRGRVSAFNSWVYDYITYTSLAVSDPDGARLLRTLNTNLATLAGFETYLEVDVAPRLTTFGSLFYVDGRDRQIDRPLANISPLEGRAGLRFHDRCGGQKWAWEILGRFVNDQDRIGGVRVGTTAPYGVTDFEFPTPGFTTVNTRGYYVVSKNLNLFGGVDNLLDNNYLEHLNLRLPPDPSLGIPGTNVFSPGITPYIGIEWLR
jgi:outer membrane receptor protein involved in Fe transport